MTTKEKSNGPLVKVDEAAVKSELGELVRANVEQTLNALLDAEADQICGATRYERNPDRLDTRAGSYTRNLDTGAGKVKLKIPKLRNLPFETAIIERYRRRESSVEEAMIEMYVAGVSVRRVEDITEALWGSKVSPSTVSNLNKKIYARIEDWRQRPIEGEHPYVFADGLFLKRSWGGEVRNVSVLVAFGVGLDGFREMLGAMEGGKEDKACWLAFFRHLKARGLKGVRLIVSDKCLGAVEAFREIYPESAWQRCVVHFYRNVLTRVPRAMMGEVAAMLKAIHAQENKEQALEKGRYVVSRLVSMKLRDAAAILESGLEETLAYMDFPRTHWIRLRTNNPMERIIKEIKRRTKVVGAFPDGQSALVLICARLRHVAASKWGTRMYLDMTKLSDTSSQATA